MSAKNELTLTRVVAAPRALVFEVWTQPEHLARWWGPEGFTLPECRVELRAGGAFRFVMRGPDGSAYPFAGTFTEVEPPARLVFVGLIHEGLEAITTVTFEELDAERTRVTVHQRHSGESEATRGAPIGWGQSRQARALSAHSDEERFAAHLIGDISPDAIRSTLLDGDQLPLGFDGGGPTATRE